MFNYKSIIPILIFFPTILFAEDLLQIKLNIAIQLYKDNKNEEAKSILLDLHKQDISGKSNYFLANVYLNLNQVDYAINHYKIAVNKNFDLSNSLYNLACAYSIINDQYNTFRILMLNFRKGDRKIKRIQTDKDLKSFRNSKFYKYFDQYIKHEEDNGYNITSKDELIQYFKDNKNEFVIYEFDRPSPPTFKFDPSGNFYEFAGGGYSGYIEGGYWQFNESDSDLIIRKIGWLADKNTTEYLKSKTKDNFDKDYRFVSYYDSPKIETIQINQIKLNIVETPNSLNEENFVDQIIIYSKFGKFNLHSLYYN